MVEGLLQDMNFLKATKINYNPCHIISHKRQINRNKEFKHHEIEGLANRAKLMEHKLDMEDSIGFQENPSTTMKTTTMIIPTPSKIEIIGTRRFLEAIEVEE